MHLFLLLITVNRRQSLKYKNYKPPPFVSTNDALCLHLGELSQSSDRSLDCFDTFENRNFTCNTVRIAPQSNYAPQRIRSRARIASVYFPRLLPFERESHAREVDSRVSRGKVVTIHNVESRATGARDERRDFCDLTTRLLMCLADPVSVDLDSIELLGYFTSTCVRRAADA